jgi:Undecaprenyl-phosphate glucose phosphotransferase
VRGLFRLSDGAVIVAAWLLSYWLRRHLVVQLTQHAKPLPVFSTYASLTPFIALLWITTFSVMGVYALGAARGRKQEVLLILKAHSVALLIFVALAYAYDEYKYSRLVMIYLFALGGAALAASRVIVRTAIRTLRTRGFHVRRVLVLGHGPAVEILVERFQRFPELGMKVIGIVTPTGDPKQAPRNLRVLGSFADLDRIIDTERPHEVLIALPPNELAHMDGLMGRLADATVNVLFVPDVSQYATLGSHIENFEGTPAIRLNDAPMDGWQSLAKRCVDVVVSCVGLMVLSPLLFLIAALVKLASPGPVLYRQERMGVDGQTFHMLKFRSMRVNAEGEVGAVWAKKSDSRRTRIGTLLRKTSLDELPQLWNVLVGHMSLVGPRPERPVFIQRFRREIPGYMLRHKVKSGITGWAQVNGWRGDTSIVERTQCDLYYIRNWSLNLDFKILTMTVWKGFMNENAY